MHPPWKIPSVTRVPLQQSRNNPLQVCSFSYSIRIHIHIQDGCIRRTVSPFTSSPSTDIFSIRATFGFSIREMSFSAAILPTVAVSCLSVVSLGYIAKAIGIPSYPHTEISSGMRSPAERIAFIPPTAEKSSGKKMQVGRLS